MKKTFFAILIAILSLWIVAPQTQAQKTSPTPTPEASRDLGADNEASESTTQKLKERIEKIVEEKKQQIQGAISDLSHQKRGFIGEIQRVTEETVTLKNLKGTQIIPLEDSLELIKKNENINPEDLAVGDWVIVLGLVENDSFVPKKITVSSANLQPRTYFVMLGTVEEISNKSVTFLSRSQEMTQELTLNTKTDFQDIEGEDASGTDFTESMQALLIGYEEEDQKIVTVLRALAPFDK